ncbi:MAG: hypothetical protein QN125_10775 [Armatimonadota bacterium]|nr:hypothetical protein [Armatimonadota bacterium]MDR7421462.1 hypothetical protein [Armatimonadota bacterium]MDR7453054.1 hypothetical protein [Armatimonadota bacterium]MDR7457748.1 hypothetical protein [Armatimonadota bacterium]
MSWRLPVEGLPDGYQVIEKEDGLVLVDPDGRAVAEFGPMVADLAAVVAAARDDAAQGGRGRMQPA